MHHTIGKRQPMTTLKDVIARIEVGPADFAEYQRYVPRIIEEAKTGKHWSEWDADVFNTFFVNNNNFLSTFTLYIPRNEQAIIKRNWGPFAEAFRELAISQDEPRWDLYKRVEHLVRQHTSKNWTKGTRRLIAALQPFLLASLFHDGQMKTVFEQLSRTVTDWIPPFNPDDWYENSHNYITLIKKNLGKEPFIGMGVYSWRLRDALSDVGNEGNDMVQRETADVQVHDPIEDCIKVLRYKPQIILQGPPGTGKTKLAKEIAHRLIFGRQPADQSLEEEIPEGHPQCKLVQFHPSYTYEDFVRGIEVKTDGVGAARYEAINRVLAKFAEDAINNPREPHVLIIDEINRANLSAVLGELIYALEYRKEAVDSMYAVKEGDGSESHRLVLPDNLYIIGTMNTADRSAGHLDYAIRRRFAFIDVLPKALPDKGFDAELFQRVQALFAVKGSYDERSTHLAEEFRPRDVALGHSYFIGLNQDPARKLRIEYEIKPILFEYLKDGVLNESARATIEELE